jgi:hypothetical protein
VDASDPRPPCVARVLDAAVVSPRAECQHASSAPSFWDAILAATLVTKPVGAPRCLQRQAQCKAASKRYGCKLPKNAADELQCFAKSANWLPMTRKRRRRRTCRRFPHLRCTKRLVARRAIRRCSHPAGPTHRHNARVLRLIGTRFQTKKCRFLAHRTRLTCDRLPRQSQALPDF